MRNQLVLFGVLAPLAVLACSSKQPPGFGDDDTTSEGGGGSNSGSNLGDDTNGGGFDLEGGVPVTLAGDCQAGHYTGTFTGTYSSYLTFVGIPIPVTGNVELTLTQGNSGPQVGEFPTYTIQNGTISGLADMAFPYFCNMVGTLDCNTKKLVGGGLRNCVYCIGQPLAGSLADGGTCLVEGHFAGPLNADYDSKSVSFVNGTWNGSEQASLNDGGLPDGGSINDAGFYVGPGNYGGSGQWKASLATGSTNGDP